MKVGDLVLMRAKSLASRFGHGIIIKHVHNRAGESCGYQVYWAKHGIGRRMNAHGLELLSES